MRRRSAGTCRDSNVCDDFTIGPDKALYVSDTNPGRIFRLPAGASTAIFIWFMLLGCQLMGMEPAGIKVSRTHSVWVGRHCTSGRLGHALFTEYTVKRVGPRMLTMTLSRVVLRTLAHGSLGGTCLDRCVVLGPMKAGRDGGANSSLSHIRLRAYPSREEYFDNEWRDNVSFRHRRHSQRARKRF